MASLGPAMAPPRSSTGRSAARGGCAAGGRPSVAETGREDGCGQRAGAPRGSGKDTLLEVEEVGTTVVVVEGTEETMAAAAVVAEEVVVDEVMEGTMALVVVVVERTEGTGVDTAVVVLAEVVMAEVGEVVVVAGTVAVVVVVAVVAGTLVAETLVVAMDVGAGSGLPSLEPHFKKILNNDWHHIKHKGRG